MLGITLKVSKILNLKQLVKHETVKYCFKHHSNMLPAGFPEHNMPNLPNTAENTYNLRDCHKNKYKYSNIKNNFIENCTGVWNELPGHLRASPYNISTRQTRNTPYKQFCLTSKKHFLHQQSMD